MSSRLTRKQLISAINDLRREKHTVQRKRGKRKSSFIHVGLKPLAKLAVAEGKANPREVYFKHHAFNNLYGRRSNLTMKDLNSDEPDPPISETPDVKPKDAEDAHVVHVDTNVPTSQTVVDCLHLGGPQGKKVKQLSNVLSQQNCVTAEGKPYNGAISYTYEGNEEDKPKMRMIPVKLDSDEQQKDIGSLGGRITEGFNELKAGNPGTWDIIFPL